MFDGVQNPTYESLRAGFRWGIPEQFNIGTACSDLQDRGALALIEVHEGRGREYTFGELADYSSRLANGLRGLGVERGDRVAIMLPQGLRCGAAHLAVYKLGAVAVPLTQLFGPQALRYRLEDSHARVVITDVTTQDVVAEVAGELGDISVVTAGGHAIPPHRDLDELVREASSTLSPVPTGPDDPAILI